MWRYLLLFLVVLPACSPVAMGIIALDVATDAHNKQVQAEQEEAAERAQEEHRRRLHELWGIQTEPAPPPPKRLSRDYGKGTEVGEWDH